MIRSAPSKLKPSSKDWIRSKITFPFSDAVVSNSHAGLKSFNAPIKKSFCIYNGFDLNRTNNHQDQKTIRDEFNLTTNKIVRMVASFSNKKDYATYILAAELILRERDDVSFLSIGDGETLQKSMSLVRPPFKNRIKFLGKHQDVESIVNTLDISVLATDTRFHGEGIFNSIMEYMVLAIPVVATDHVGTKELVINGQTGFLIKPSDAKNMSIKITQLLESSELANRMGNAGKKRITDYFDSDKMTTSYVCLCKNILRRKAPENESVALGPHDLF